jgi:plasmid stability protein
MSKKFLLDLPDIEHRALKIAAAQANRSMHQFVRDAITEKIQREHASASLHAPDAHATETEAPANED